MQKLLASLVALAFVAGPAFAQAPAKPAEPAASAAAKKDDKKEAKKDDKKVEAGGKVEVRRAGS